MRGELAHGTLLVTGVSPRPDAAGEQFVTITGVINGPTVNEHVVYQRLAVDVEQWPTMGDCSPSCTRRRIRTTGASPRRRGRPGPNAPVRQLGRVLSAMAMPMRVSIR